jgi:nucleotide-binding universal stress UspA family protein
MLTLKRILLPVDFSERSQAAAQLAVRLAARFHCTIDLLHVLAPLGGEDGAIESGGELLEALRRERWATANAEMASFAAAALAGVETRAEVAEGLPAPLIVAAARRSGAGLIVMPTHGHGPFRRFILGSNTAEVLRDAECPVATGVHLERLPALAGTGFSSVLCAVDLGPQSRRALEWAAGLAEATGARLTLLHAASTVSTAASAGEAGWNESVCVEARAEAVRLVEAVGCQADVAIEAGDPARAIREVAGRVGAELLVIARGSAGGVFGRLRANAYAIIRESPCPVVSV